MTKEKGLSHSEIQESIETSIQKMADHAGYPREDMVLVFSATPGGTDCIQTEDFDGVDNLYCGIPFILSDLVEPNNIYLMHKDDCPEWRS
jgi:hypothetical protein